MCSNTPAVVAVLQGKFKGNIINHFSHVMVDWLSILQKLIISRQFIIINMYASNRKQNNEVIFLTI